MSFANHEPSNHIGKTDIWLTPKWIPEKLGTFTLDPCAQKGWEHAENNNYSNGLELKWFGRVWLNPPYSNIDLWVKKLTEHNHGVLLCFVRSDTRWFQHALLHATSIFFFKKRVKFIREDLTEPKSSSGAPSCLLFFGEKGIPCGDGFLANLR